jgi:hypothetical protein
MCCEGSVELNQLAVVWQTLQSVGAAMLVAV